MTIENIKESLKPGDYFWQVIPDNALVLKTIKQKVHRLENENEVDIIIIKGDSEKEYVIPNAPNVFLTKNEANNFVRYSIIDYICNLIFYLANESATMPEYGAVPNRCEEVLKQIKHRLMYG